MNHHPEPHARNGATPTPGKGGRAARESTDKADSTLGRIKSPRQFRALRALVAGPVTREQLDRTANASNGPHVVMTLCRRFGLRIDCDTSQPFTDRDGRQTFPGVYRLNPDDRARAIALLDASGVTA